jgi:hypothetical protein
VRRYLPKLIRLVLDGKINPGKVFDLILPLDEVAEGYRATDERRAIKTLLRARTKHNFIEKIDETSPLYSSTEKSDDFTPLVESWAIHCGSGSTVYTSRYESERSHRRMEVSFT